MEQSLLKIVHSTRLNVTLVLTDQKFHPDKVYDPFAEGGFDFISKLLIKYFDFQLEDIQTTSDAAISIIDKFDDELDCSESNDENGQVFVK